MEIELTRKDNIIVKCLGQRYKLVINEFAGLELRKL
jgi:hypothetical protein